MVDLNQAAPTHVYRSSGQKGHLTHTLENLTFLPYVLDWRKLQPTLNTKKTGTY
ncbi:hypothetical protein LINPERHAP1_LOCUS18218, partial [Linum perenne]